MKGILSSFNGCRPAKRVLLSALLGTQLMVAACSRTQSAAPKPPPPPPLEYIGEWGAKGDGPGQLQQPVSIATDSIGNVYVTDASSGFVHKFSFEGRPLLSFQDDSLKLPVSVAVDAGDAIYVADAKRHNIVIFWPDGERLREIRCAFQGRSQEPRAVAVDDDGSIFVAEPGSHQIQKFNQRGRLLKTWEMPAGDSSGEQLAVAGAVGPDGFLYFFQIEQILKFTRDGELAATWKNGGGADPVVPLSGIAVSDKYVFAAETGKWRVQVWTLDGQQKLAGDLSGHTSENATNLNAIAVSPRRELLVLDGAAARILRYRINF